MAEELNNFFKRYKAILALIICLPYLVIGFSEALSGYIFDTNFKQNMFYWSIIGLSYPFSDEVLMLYNAIKNRKRIENQNKKSDAENN